MVEGSVFRRHPIAITLYIIYLIGWVWLGYIAYLDFTGHGGGETITARLVGFCLFVMLPFLTGAMIFAAFSKKASKFYFRLTLLILAPTPFVLIGAMVFHIYLGSE